MDELVEFYLATLRDLLIADDVPREIAWRIVELVRAGNLDAGALLEAVYDRLRGETAAPRSGLAAMVEMLAQYTTSLDAEEITLTDIKGAAATLSELGSIAEELGNPAMAYNFFEVSYHLLDLGGVPALKVSRHLRHLSNPENLVQHYGAIWRLAAEELREALDKGDGWLAALDAVELALTCRVPHYDLQQKLFEKLHLQVQRAQGTPIEDLILQVIFETPSGTSADAVRSRALTALVFGQAGPMPAGATTPAPPPEVVEGAAVLRVQSAVGDMRLRFLPQADQRAQIDFDLRYRDARLAHAVPVGRSLIVDPERTSALLLDMAHEVGHAVVLQGALGSRQGLYRAVATFCEFMLFGEAHPEGDVDWPLDRLQPVPELPNTRDACTFADMQLAAAEKGAVERAVWRSWLEGVSLYIELLCDPKDDPTEISIVHECVRGLIDFAIERRPDESEEAFQARYSEEIVAQFEELMSGAIEKGSRVNHVGYAHNHQAGESARDIYVLGYLVVRSVVSAWEHTLGRRLPPGIAVKLLLNATQVGTHDALPDPLASPRDHWEDAPQRYLRWVIGLAALDKEALESFFAPIAPGERGLPTIWRNGRPQRVTEITAAIAAIEEEGSESVYRQAQVLAGMDPDLHDGPRVPLQQMLRTLLAQQFEWNGLLPIGADRPRLMFLQHDDRYCLAIRTYAGNEKRKRQAEAAGTPTDRWDPRYHLRLIPSEGGDAERDSIRAAFAAAGTGRAYAMRIIDLRGHEAAPLDVRGASFVCVFLPAGYDFVLQGQTLQPITTSHPEFVALLKSRMFPPFAFIGEGETIASLAFLSKRAERAGCNPPIFETHSEDTLIDLAHSVALMAGGLAFGKDDFAKSYKHAMTDTEFRSAVANVLHASGRSLPLVGDASLDQAVLREQAAARQVFDPTAVSIVTPFGATP